MPNTEDRDELLVDLIEMGLDPDVVELMRPWSDADLAAFAFSLANIIHRARTEKQS